MNFSNLMKIAYSAILRNKTRTLLTILGVVIGISSVIAMVSLGQSSTKNIKNQVSTMGTNLIMVMRANEHRGGVSMGSDNVQSLTVRDVESIQRQAKNLAIDSTTHKVMITPSVSANGQAVRGNNNHVGQLQGGNTEMLAIRKYEIARGSNFTDEDIAKYAKVCVIGQTVVDELFPNGEDPIGKDIRVKSIPMKVIGVLESKGQNQMGQDQDDIIFAPYTTVQKRFLAINYIHMIYASAASEDVADAATTEMALILRENHKLNDDANDDFEVRTQAEMMQMMGSISDYLTYLVVAIASISLIVGGIGIMNIMYVTVTERTKEIGLRMAIGARGRDILMQFLIESAILSLIGGLIGIVFGLILSYVISAVLGWPFVVSVAAIIISFVVCAFTGIFFGWYPAKKASKLDPITALRYE